MATHSSILAWRTPWTEEPGGLQSMGSQRAWHNWATFTSLHFHLTSLHCLFQKTMSPGGKGWSFSVFIANHAIPGFPGGSDGKESTCNAGHLDSIPGPGRSPEEGNGNPLQYSCLENPRDRGAWWAAVCGFAQSQTWLKQLSSSSMVWNGFKDLGEISIIPPVRKKWIDLWVLME